MELGNDIPFFLITDPLDLITEYPALIEAIRAHSVRPRIICIDTLNRSLRGSENRDEDMAAYLRAATAIGAAFDCLVLVVHHTGHDRRAPRGHSSLTGAVDVQIKVDRSRLGATVMTVESMKDGPGGDVFTSKLKPVVVGTNTSGEPIATCVVAPVESARTHDAKTVDRLPRGARIALGALEDLSPEVSVPEATGHGQAVSIRALRDRCYQSEISPSGGRARQMAFKRALDRLVTEGHVRIVGDQIWRIDDAVPISEHTNPL
jgi:hypothetical protein